MFRERGTHIYLCQFMLMYVKNQHNIVITSNQIKQTNKKEIFLVPAGLFREITGQEQNRDCVLDEDK